MRGLLPAARDAGVAEELRGWNWNQPPLSAVYNSPLAIYEVANKYCPSGRDLYLRRVENIRAVSSFPMIQGRILHQVLADLLTYAKRLIYSIGVQSYQEILDRLSRPEMVDVEKYTKDLSKEELDDIKRKIDVLVKFETSRIAARIQETLVKQPYIGEDALVANAIPIVVEQKLDGSFLGLSANLSTDAFTFTEPVIMDIKFGEPQKFHRLITTGYALVIEAMHEYPVNLGCIVYAGFKGDRLTIRKDIHIIGDELRQWFIEERDEKMRCVSEEIDPGFPEECPDHCICIEHCGR